MIDRKFLIKVRFEIEIPLTIKDLQELAKDKQTSFDRLSKEAGFERRTLWDILNRRGGGQYSTLRKILLPIVDIKPLVKEAIDRFLQ